MGDDRKRGGPKEKKGGEICKNKELRVRGGILLLPPFLWLHIFISFLVSRVLEIEYTSSSAIMPDNHFGNLLGL